MGVRTRPATRAAVAQARGQGRRPAARPAGSIWRASDRHCRNDATFRLLESEEDETARKLARSGCAHRSSGSCRGVIGDSRGRRCGRRGAPRGIPIGLAPSMVSGPTMVAATRSDLRRPLAPFGGSTTQDLGELLAGFGGGEELTPNRGPLAFRRSSSYPSISIESASLWPRSMRRPASAGPGPSW